MRRALPILCLLAACGGSPKGDTSNTTVTVEPYDGETADGPSLDDSRAAVARMAALFEELGDGVDRTGANCDAMAASITAWTATYGDEVKALNIKLSTMPKAHVEKLAPQLEASMRRSALQIKDGSDRCPDHDGLFKAKSGLRL